MQLRRVSLQTGENDSPRFHVRTAPDSLSFSMGFSHGRLVGDLSIFYRYFNGHCSQEIRDIIPVPLRCVRTTRSSTHSHPFQVSLPNPRTLSHKSSFIIITANVFIVCRHFHGHCSQEIRDIIPVPLRRVRTTRSSTNSHPFQVSLPTSRTLSHKSSFIPRRCNL